MYQSIPSITSLPPRATIGQIIKIWQMPSHPGKFFCPKCQAPGFPGFHFNKFYTFPPLSRSQSLEYLEIHMKNLYLSIQNMLLYVMMLCIDVNTGIHTPTTDVDFSGFPVIKMLAK